MVTKESMIIKDILVKLNLLIDSNQPTRQLQERHQIAAKIAPTGKHLMLLIELEVFINQRIKENKVQIELRDF